MEFGFMMAVSPREPLDRFATLAKMAEEFGFTMAWVGDSQLIFKNAYVAMTLAAVNTQTIAIGPGVTPLVTRHTTEIANAISAIHEVSSGRAFLGLGVGDSSVRPLGLKMAKRSELEDSVAAIRGLCSGKEVSYRGQEVRMRPHSGEVPIYISASQPKMLRLAGKIADGVILLGAADTTVTRWQLDHIEAGAKEVGRSIDDVFVDLYVGISASSDLTAGRQEVRPYATSQARWFSRWKDLPEPLTPYTEEMTKAYDAYDFYYHVSRQGDHNQIISDDLVDIIAVVGDADACAQRLDELSKLKIDRISFLNFPGGRERHMSDVAEHVLPHLTRK